MKKEPIKSHSCIRAIISGKVQGVFYRDSTRKKAQSLSITGWVKNNADGTVELHACGTKENIQKLVDWLWQGPSAAKVTNIVVHEIPEEEHQIFNMIR